MSNSFSNRVKDDVASSPLDRLSKLERVVSELTQHGAGAESSSS